MQILITGGAGFIGSHLAQELLRQGHAVRVLDSLVPQVHGLGRHRPGYLHPEVELVVGDLRDSEAVSRAIDRMDAVIHLAALVGVGQSMYRIADHTSANNLGTANLLQALSIHPVERLLVASSMSIYGEGLYSDADGYVHTPRERTLEQLRKGEWEVHDCRGKPLFPIATPEDKRPMLASVYGLSKFDQESLCLIFGRAYGIPCVSLRLFNTYGPNQALSNPYTGVISNFISRILNKKSPVIFEDGMQQRDFVSVYDVVRAFVSALKTPAATGHAFNIGSGSPVTIRELAERTIRAIGRLDIEPEITGEYRAGDIRHCFADITAAHKVLGWEPRVRLEDGLRDLTTWVDGQNAIDRVPEAREELASRGLLTRGERTFAENAKHPIYTGQRKVGRGL